MPSYKVIADEVKVKEFLNWLPKLNSDEVYYAALLARSKYVKDLGIGTFNSDRYQCARFLSSGDRLFKRIWQTEAPLGSYVVKGVTVPQEALAMYVNPNPRSLKGGQMLLMKRSMDALFNKQTDYDIYQDSISCVHKSISKKHFVDFDFDDADLSETVKNIAKVVNPDAVTIVETRGGFHALIKTADVEKKYKSSWYQNMIKMTGVDVVGDTMLPIPGTYQGMYVPTMEPLKSYL